MFGGILDFLFCKTNKMTLLSLKTKSTKLFSKAFLVLLLCFFLLILLFWLNFIIKIH